MLFYKHFKGTGKKEIYFKKISGLRYRSKSQNDLYLSLIRSVKKAALRISASSWDILAPRLSARIQAGLVIEEWISSGQKNKKSLWVFSQTQLCRSLNTTSGRERQSKPDCDIGLVIHLRRKRKVCDYYVRKSVLKWKNTKIQ